MPMQLSDSVQADIYTVFYKHVKRLISSHHDSRNTSITITDLSLLTGKSEEFILECLEFGQGHLDLTVYH
ncbi:hypothetical protein AJ85_12055 [Alkalihalobacillus alcalophilus ATCC 27647 = CGMCC 1.3604]|uniref:Uncharacterized protein n=1 Tax=Alkalihalobacillus alcalophilus ATCC 27647 = CGMCC 1.3604 TaxID=1218173 RepID=A0A094WDR3_ALKAL|nr:hypothetical protein [Alkalihalobacillus alcalophilus]KGA95889.1 hypothetical protein BALCAV_0219630 [Alkalihalobacillus alcalophilus ATCC 27647 = CGMCC 1.3604]MED1562900.1 hypothetical protein [Alkalihalobacillus alcalophilus]THG90213.1 hypothetical protein AJ85_12055 [Alkalihalobacillus alcalophilus ATCC 27647 = CGMCC 1.3604]